MDTNTVVLSLNDYNQLREFKEKMEEGNTYKIPQPYTSIHAVWGSTYSAVNYVTTDMAVIELLERNKDLSEINEKLRREIVELNSKRFDSKVLKEMSVWEFMRWKKTR